MVQLTSLDFAGYKQQIKAYLQTKPEFTDHNFEGSIWSAVLDVLAYDAQKFGFLANTTFSERFLDTATLEKNVRSIAKRIGYKSRSKIAAKAIVRISFPSATLGVTIPKNTIFLTSINGTFFTFVTSQDYLCPSGQSVDIEIFQGQYIDFTYSFPTVNKPFEIPNASIDTTKTEVFVNGVKWAVAEDITSISPTSQVFFQSNNWKGMYDVSFGSNQIGKSPNPNDTILIRHFVTFGEKANGASTFTSNTIGGFAPTLVTQLPSYGGAEQESIESIRFSAPKSYAAQNRAITENDYISLIKQRFNQIKTIRVWGGNENDPPMPSQVFVSAKTASGNLTSQEKSDIATYITSKNILGLPVNVIDPEPLLMQHNLLIKYSRNLETRSSVAVEQLVRNKIIEYNDLFMGLFDNSFYFASFSKWLIDQVPSIQSIITTLTLKLSKTRQYNTTTNITFDYSRPVENFMSSQYLNRDGVIVEMSNVGDLIYEMLAGTNTIIRQVGTINKITGMVSITDFRASGSGNVVVDGLAKSTTSDTVSIKNRIVEFDIPNLVVSAVSI